MKFDEKKFLKKIIKKTGKTINRNNLISQGDCILIGLSGGKDSLALADILSERRKKLPIHYCLKAVHIKLEGVKYSSDIDYLKNFCKKRNIEFLFHSEKINLDGSKKNPCFYCSFSRRRILFQYMKSLGCNKLALGHNMEDAVETFFMNILFRNRLSSLPYKLSMFNGEFEIIRPLLEIREQYVEKYVRLNNLVTQQIKCPFENKSNRFKVRKMIESNENFFEGFTEKVFYSMSKIDLEYLPGNFF